MWHGAAYASQLHQAGKTEDWKQKVSPRFEVPVARTHSKLPNATTTTPQPRVTLYAAAFHPAQYANSTATGPIPLQLLGRSPYPDRARESSSSTSAKPGLHGNPSPFQHSTSGTLFRSK